jgi:catechol 2,3-dioxygenase
MADDQSRAALPPDTHIGRVALRVGSLEELRPFYRRLGFAVERDGRRASLVTADGTDLLILTETPDAPDRPSTAAGLFHFAIRVPSRRALADSLVRLEDAGLRLTGASDHLVSEALYLRDPEGNGIEIYRDLPREDWPRTDDGGVGIDTLPLDTDALRAEGAPTDRFPSGTDMGHVHLEVTDIDRAREFYVDSLGFQLQATDPRGQAAFVAAGGYHHHVGLNVWNGRSDRAGNARGLEWYELVVPDGDARRQLGARLDARSEGGALVVSDPDGIELRLVADAAPDP